MMKMDQKLTLVLHPDFDREALFQNMEKTYSRVPVAMERPSDLTWYDTFDWRLWLNGLVLLKHKKEFQLVRQENEEILLTESSEVRNFRPVSCKDLAMNDLRSKIAPIIEPRALLPLVSVQRISESFRCLNSEGKTVARICFEEMRIPDQNVTAAPFLRLLTVDPLRGYGNEAVAIRDLAAATLNAEPINHNPLPEAAWKAVGRVPGDYSARLGLTLMPEMPAWKAVGLVVKRLLEIVQINETGVWFDIDSEFLHDYRVAIRKIRSNLGELKCVYDRDALAPFLQTLRDLGKSCNTVRDLDITLLQEESCRKSVPDWYAESLDPFFRDITRLRRKEFLVLRRFLKSGKIDRDLDRWISFFGNGPHADQSGKRADHPIGDLVAKKIRKRHKKLIGKGNAITPVSAPEDFHRLRIECKKMRYLLEAFASLFPHESLEKLTRQLKSLQTLLGNLNDQTIQLETLHRKESKIRSASSRKTIRYVAALGALSGSLHRQRILEQQQFFTVFAEFSDNDTTDLITSLCGHLRKTCQKGKQQNEGPDQ